MSTIDAEFAKALIRAIGDISKEEAIRAIDAESAKSVENASAAVETSEPPQDL